MYTTPDPESLLLEASYEFKGKENYKPTPSFLQKVYLFLDLQLFIILILQLILTNWTAKIISQPLIDPGLVFYIPECTFILIFILQHSFTSQFKNSAWKCAFAMIIRSFVFGWFTTIICPSGCNKEITLFISLLLSLHLTLTIFTYIMEEHYKWQKALLFVGIWNFLAANFLFILKEFIVKGLFSNWTILLCISLVSLYGLYLIYQTKFLLNGAYYAINHHQWMFGAFILQFDLVGILSWMFKKYKEKQENQG